MATAMASLRAIVRSQVNVRAPHRLADISLNSRAKKVIELAADEAREMGHEYVGTEHLLIALLREEKGIAAQILTALLNPA